MTKGKLILLTSSLVVLITGLGAGFLFLNPDALIEKTVQKQVAETFDSQDISDSRFEIIFCGTGSPQRREDRGQPCLGIVAAGKFFLFDAGQGTAQRLNQFRAPLQRLDTIFLTHLHSDHMSGLGETLHNGWLYGRQHLVEVVGPPGTEKVLAGYQQVYEDDIEERQRVLGSEYLDTRSGMGKARDVRIDDEGATTVYKKDGVLIEAFRVDHPDWPYAYGYRVSFKGKLVVISGDTAYTPAFKHHAQGADILIHEALNVDLMAMLASALDKQDTGMDPARMKRISKVHTPTDLVAKTAQEAGVKKLVLTHLIPPIPASRPVERFFSRGMGDIYEGEIIVARDGMRIVLIP